MLLLLPLSLFTNISLQSLHYLLTNIQWSSIWSKFERNPFSDETCTILDQVIDLKNVKVLKEPGWIEKSIKNDEKIFLSIFSLSAPQNFEDRQNLRTEIENFRTNSADKIVGSIQLTFLLGLPSDRDLQSWIDIESDLFGDILQISVEDSYQNLSYKTLGAYQWIHSVCL